MDLEVEIEGKTYLYDKEALKEVSTLQGQGSEIIREYLDEPITSLCQQGQHSTSAVACALIELAYKVLRFKSSPEKANNAFNLLAYYIKENIESEIEQGNKNTQ